VNSVIDAPPSEVIAAGLAKLRRRRWLYGLAFFGFVPAVVIAGLLIGLLPEGWRRIGWYATAIVPIGGLVLINRLQKNLQLTKCPRCGSWFHGPNQYGRLPALPGGVFPRRCQNCGLRLNGANLRPDV
jgi:hypothetical protein